MNSAMGKLSLVAVALDLSPGLLSSSNLNGFGLVAGSGVGGFLELYARKWAIDTLKEDQTSQEIT